MANEIARTLRKRMTPQEVNYDAQRDKLFSGNGFQVLRFWNNAVDENMHGVLTLISETLRKPPPGLAARDHPPPSGEG